MSKARKLTEGLDWVLWGVIMKVIKVGVWKTILTTNIMTQFNYNDGGRGSAGYKGSAGDCAVRAIAIATGIPYQEIYDEINQLGEKEHIGKRKRGKSNARTGVYKNTFKKFLTDRGWKWVPTMFIGSGCKVHLKAEELPMGKIICNVSKHYVAMINGVINDTYDCSRNGTRCVYGYYTK